MRRLNSEDTPAPPFEYWMSASVESLRNFEILQLSHAANLEKEILVMMRERDRARVLAEVVRLLIDHRDEFVSRAGDHLERLRGEPKFLPESS